MTAPAGDALSHENLLAAPESRKLASRHFLEGDSASGIAAADIRRLAPPGQICSARICMAAMSGTSRVGDLHLTITWTQLPATADDFIWK